MTAPARMRHMDVSNTVDVTDPAEVTQAVRSIMDGRYPGYDFTLIDVLIADFIRLYRGSYPGYQACDIGYHNIQHVLDVTLAMARLIDGHDGSCPEGEKLGPDLALAGIACTVYHDAGYIRRVGDNKDQTGAAYTRIHVSRSALFMAEYFPTIGLESIVPLCERIVHFTGYEVDPCNIEVESEREYVLGSLLGTADLIAQMADLGYVQKCYDELYLEFVAGGIAGDDGLEGYSGLVYRSPEHLLESTPDFIRSAIEVRLEGYFKSAYRYAAAFFEGPNLYMESIERNRLELEHWLAAR